MSSGKSYEEWRDPYTLHHQKAWSSESFIFSFRTDKRSSITTLSRVIKEKSAISDDDGHFIGFGHGDLKVFQGVCQRKDYMCSIRESSSFQIFDYEVFKVVKKEF
ncbi:9111_t:CDS:2 [Funneliformis mosseae]|uniref:9111_t:CDS:1 n=1 Tax=Funneliformis mosseae TaxID=27381 RepID=A0A9N8V8N9_FUNMO|nr:9111_t:CDS:2 [Funneliformis mosseae]